MREGSEESGEWRQTVHKLYYKGARYMNLLAGLSLAFPACTAGFILAAWIGKHYPGAALLMSAFCVSTQVNLLTGPGTSILRGIGKINEEFYYALPNVAFLVVTLPLSRLLLHGWTVVGVGMAVAISTLLSAAIFLVRAHRVMGIPLKTYARQVLLPGVAPYFVALPMGFLGMLFLTHLSRWQEVGALALLGSIYMALCLLVIATVVLTEGEKLWFKAMIPVRRRAQAVAQELIPSSGD
jgi:O-antigen/teichoic acid export membrane protein